MDRQNVIRTLEEIAPPALAEPMDEGRIGLVVEGREEIGRIAASLDATPAVVRQAREMSVDMLVVHHSPLFQPITAIRGVQAAILREALAGGMNVYVLHTNFDHAPGGINDALADLLGLADRRPMTLGLVGRCRLPLDAMVRRIGGGVRVYGNIDHLEELAVVGGSGFDPALLDEAAEIGADAFLSAELKHHVMLAAPIPCIESTHAALEAPGMQRLAERMHWEYIDGGQYTRVIP